MPPLSKRLLLIGWDAADWQVIHPLIDAGLMPTLERLINEGAMGSLRTLQPMLSPLLWTSIATGKRAARHGILGFVEPAADGTRLQPVQSTSRTCKALWNILSQSGLRSHAVGWYASHPAESLRGVCVSNQFVVPPAGATPEDWSLSPGAVSPPELAERIADLRLHPLEVEPSLIQMLIPKAAELDQTLPQVQHLLTALRQRLAECISIHSIATDLLEHEPWEFATVYYECIDQVGHDYMPFHPPRLPWINEHAFEAFREVMTGIYRWHDLMLGRLVELAGPDAHILLVSDHGFLNDERRPSKPVEPAQWHRPEGIFLLHGPGVKADATIHNLNLLDIAPTVLTLFGLPVGRDMEGRVVAEALVEPPEVTHIESWEAVPDPEGRPAPAVVAADRAAEEAAMQQLVELGYLAPPGADEQVNIARARAEQKFNLAASHLDGREPRVALPLARELCAEFPQEPRYPVLLGQCAVTAADPQAVGEAVALLEQIHPGEPRVAWLRGMQSAFSGDWASAVPQFEAAIALAPHDPFLPTKLGRMHLRLRQWPEAEQAFRRALALSADNAEALYGLSVALPRQDRVEEGMQAGLRAVALFPTFPEAHFQLGAVLSRLGWFERAAESFELSLAQRPGLIAAHNYLAKIYARMGHHERAGRHRVIAEQLAADGVPQPLLD